MQRIALTVLSLAVLAGCEQPPPPAPITERYNMADPAQWCAAAAEGLSHPWMNDFQKQAILDGMRNRKCMG